MTATTNNEKVGSWTATLRRFALTLVLGATFAVPFGCLASAQDAFIEIDAAPHHYESRPHTVYHGEPVYYVDGRWYARHGHRWAYYRDEPRDLVRYRHEYRAPRVHHHYHERRVIEVR